MKFSINAAVLFTCISLPCLLFMQPAFPSGGTADVQAGSSQTSIVPRESAQKGKTFPDPSLPEGIRVSEHLFGLVGLKNVGRITPGVYRGAQPGSEGYATLKKMGIRTVVNLRTTVSEKRAVEAAGMKSVEIPIGMFNNRDLEKVDKIVALMADPANRPVFVHCKLGQDRTGIVVAAYRMKIDGWPLNLAEAEMESFGFNGVWVNLRHFLHRYAAGLKPGNQTKMTVAGK
jgi:tyrosine-protein phosphatase SIW14